MKLQTALLFGLSLLTSPAMGQATQPSKTCPSVSGPSAASVAAQPKPADPRAVAKPGPQVSKPSTEGDSVALNRSQAESPGDQSPCPPIRTETKPLAFDPPKN